MAERDWPSLLDEIPQQVLLLDRQFRILRDNRGPGGDEPCYKRLWARDSPCPECRLESLLEQGVSFRRAGSTADQPPRFLVGEYRRVEGQALLFLDDRSAMVSALKAAREQMELSERQHHQAGEKAKAQLLVAKNRNKLLTRDLETLQTVFATMASGVLLIDPHFKIKLHNQQLADLLQNFHGLRELPASCYKALYARDAVCGDCPIRDRSLSHRIRSQFLKTDLAEGYLTEEISATDRGFVLTVSNSTRTIELAKNIQTYLREIEEINRLLAATMERGAAMQMAAQADVVLNQLLHMLAEQFFESRVPLLLYTRLAEGRNVEHVVFQGVAEGMRQAIIQASAGGDEALRLLLEDWWMVPFGSEQRPARLWVHGTALEEKRHNILKILLSMVTSLLEQLGLLRELERLASMDGLTGTYNRRYFESRFEEEKEKCRTVGLPFGILVIDLNGLKRINDVYGHQAGDEFIKTAGNLLRIHLREQDVLARFGGDEYVALLPSTDARGVEIVRDRVVQAQQGASYHVSRDSTDTIVEPIHFSVGAASSAETEIDEVFGKADERMYEDKERYYANRSRYR